MMTLRKYALKQWKDIEGYEGYYLVSNYGDIKSLSRRVFFGHSHKCKRITRDRIMIGSQVPRGYKTVLLSKNGRKTNHYTHILVARHFVPNLQNKKQVNHRDGNKQNNLWNNLEWCTNQENRNHALANDLQGAKLTRIQVMEIRRRYIPKKKGNTIMLMKEYGVSRSAIQAIIYKRNWKNI